MGVAQTLALCLYGHDGVRSQGGGARRDTWHSGEDLLNVQEVHPPGVRVPV